jgi:uncharacterized membrane-anchored protein
VSIRHLFAAIVMALLCCGRISAVYATDGAAAEPSDNVGTSDADAERASQFRALKWVKGPASVDVGENAKLNLPEGYVFLDRRETIKFIELTQNFGSGQEVMVAPKDLGWFAYLVFEGGGYVKDDEKIDAAALLQSLQENTERQNAERQKRGWSPIHVVGWASQPAYNSATHRLEWAVSSQSTDGPGVNFFTKILGRRGHTSVVMVAEPQNLQSAETALNGVLNGYKFNPGETYAEWKPGDKVAEYGLAALVLGGAAAVATKKGFWAVLAGFLAAAWKFAVAGAVAIMAWVRNLFKKKA